MDLALNQLKQSIFKQDFFSLAGNRKTIVLYNPLSGKGHFDSWCALFTRSLVVKGWSVCVLTPDASRILSELQDLSEERRQQVLILDPQTCLPLSPLAQYLTKNKLSLNLQHYLVTTLRNRTDVRRGFVDRLHRMVCRKLHGFFLRKLNPSFKVSPHSPIDFYDDIQLVRQLMSSQPQIILNMYLDIYSNVQTDWEPFYRKVDWHWTGIHIDINNTLPAIYKSKLKGLKSIFYINEDLDLSKLKQIGHIDHHWLPDVASTALPDQPTPLTLKATSLAKGRKIIFLGGAIGGTKNIAAWCAVIRLLDPREWFFIQAGVVDRTTLSINDLTALQDIESNPPENLLTFDHYLKNDSEFNELISISDLIWGIYRDFDRSSNILGKSAMFHKPILVSNKFLMGQRVKEYGIGLAVDENSAKQIAESIAFLISHPVDSKHFDRYSLEHGPEALSDKLDQSLTKYCQTEKLD
ncbi:glycosyltransferase family 4 protein [Orrella sp. NBD-18]|uniref:Glycosyltransferase family 4 protein n=1 Tax=Sheuella amnicola TaxID=2707330 RepID=A0A6B2QZL2_9BURK|nr:glycosyltransferase family 4 protein [Sheuella amnicola]NDY83462.1 glycosyltransferase family 4 protein [Sheuella amnicola]